MSFLSNIFYPNFLKRFDRYLLVNYPVIWETKAHFVAFYSFFLGNILLFLIGILMIQSFNIHEIPTLQIITDIHLQITATISILAFIFYGFYLYFFQNKIYVYSFSEIIQKYCVVFGVVLSFASNIIMPSVGASFYVNIYYNLSEVRADLAYIRKMEVLEEIIVCLHYADEKEKKTVLKKIKNTHFNQHNEMDYLVNITQKMDIFFRNVKQQTQDSNMVFFESVIAKYEKENPHLKGVRYQNYTWANKRDEKNRRGENLKKSMLIDYESKKEARIRQGGRILYEEFIKQNFKNECVVYRLLCDNFLHDYYEGGMKNFADVPFILELEKVNEILEKYKDYLGKEFMPLKNPTNYEHIKNLENILTYSFQKHNFKYFKNLLNEMENKYYNKIDDFSIQRFDKTESYVKNVSFFEYSIKQLDTPEKYLEVASIYNASQINIFIFLKFVMLFFLFSTILLLTKMWAFKNLLSSVIFSVFFLILFITNDIQHRQIIGFSAPIILIFLLIAFIYDIYNSKTRTTFHLFWCVVISDVLCFINLFQLFTFDFKQNLSDVPFLWSILRIIFVKKNKSVKFVKQ